MPENRDARKTAKRAQKSTEKGLDFLTQARYVQYSVAGKGGKYLMKGRTDSAVYLTRAHKWTTVLMSAVLTGTLVFSTWAANFFTETFTGTAGGWLTRDGEMTVSQNAGMGTPAADGALQGTFALQDPFSPQTDAFIAGGLGNTANFTGNYWNDVPNFSSWSFNFYADDVLPTDVIVRFGNGVNTFFRGVTINALDTWTPVTVSLSYAGWFGGSAGLFSNVLSNVTFVEVQVSRNGAGVQDYFIDNFALNQANNGGGGSAVPEPEQGLLILGAMVLFAFRRTRQALARG